MEVAMRRVIVSIVCVVSCLVTSAETAQSTLANHPIVGDWKLSVARSTGASIRLAVTVSPSSQIDMTTMGLSAQFRLDGKEHPTFGVMATWEQAGTGSWNAVVKNGVKTTSIDHYVLSADERTLTITTETPGRSMGVPETLVLTRASGGPGLAGVWQGRRSVGDAAAQYAVEDGKLRIHLSPSEERWLAPLDGKDYAWSMPGAEPGRLMARGQLVDARTISIVLKEKGVAFHYATLSVSADGRTLQIDQVHGPTADAPERSRLVYERR